VSGDEGAPGGGVNFAAAAAAVVVVVSGEHQRERYTQKQQLTSRQKQQWQTYADRVMYICL
jgi:hypothetical protein